MTIKDLKFNFKTFICGHPSLYFLYPLFPRFRHRLVTENTKICIEGFPRSGNTFAYHTFKFFNPDIKVGHHVHSIVQVNLSVFYNVPCIIMIREPLDSIASLIIVDNQLSPRAALKHYIRYYEMLVNYKDKVIVANIELINDNFDSLIAYINNEFDFSFDYEPLNNELRANIRTIVSKQNDKANNPENLIATPNKEKESLKNKVKPKLKNNSLFKQANELYKEINEHLIKFE